MAMYRYFKKTPSEMVLTVKVYRDHGRWAFYESGGWMWYRETGHPTAKAALKAVRAWMEGYQEVRATPTASRRKPKTGPASKSAPTAKPRR